MQRHQPTQLVTLHTVHAANACCLDAAAAVTFRRCHCLVHQVGLGFSEWLSLAVPFCLILTVTAWGIAPAVGRPGQSTALSSPLDGGPDGQGSTREGAAQTNSCVRGWAGGLFLTFRAGLPSRLPQVRVLARVE